MSKATVDPVDALVEVAQARSLLPARTISTLTPAQLADRAKGIGGSDAAAALGLHPYKTALQLYLEKTGEIPQEDLTNNELVEWGIRLEDAVRQKSAELAGDVIRLPAATIWHPSFDWLYVHPDGFFDGDDDTIYSGKIAARMDKWGEPDSGDVPEHYFVQSQQEMAVMSAARGKPFTRVVYGVLFGDFKHRRYVVESDPDTQALILEGLIEFRSAWTAKLPPAPDFNARTTRDLIQRLYPGTDGTTLIATPSQIAWRTVMEEARDKAAVYEAAADAAKSALLFDMKSAAQLIFPDGQALRRKVIEKKPYTVEPKPYVDARMVKAKE